MRIYVPSCLTELVTPADLPPRLVHAVTPALRAELPEEDEEGLEYAAQLLAADDSLDLLDGQGPAGRRRVVVAADVPDHALVPAEDPHAPSVVRLDRALAWAEVACAHVDEPEAEADVAATLTGEDDDAPERLAERDLLWFDVTELPRLASGVVRA